MAPRRRRVVWAERARDALDETIAYIAQNSPITAQQFLVRILDAAGSLDLMSERGRVVPELDDADMRELMVDSYRLLYRVHENRVTIVAFVHGARDFGRWVRELPAFD